MQPFSAYTELDYEQALKALDPLRRRFRARLGRRMRSARRGRMAVTVFCCIVIRARGASPPIASIFPRRLCP